ncbi:hypothetical protein [Sphingomonas sp.]|jgi:hypothetical protein|uniref:hypothetical protein n=1 Tax=Sphingomonas sp. TaxID=28214 RepID=UPI002ED86FFA
MTDVTLQDIGRVAWGPTMKLAFGRSIAASCVITPLMLMFAGMPLIAGPVYFIALAVTLPIGGPIYHFMLKGLARIFETMGLGIVALGFNLLLGMVALIASAGDPIVYFVNRRYPELFEAADLKVFNFRVTIFVLNNRDFAPARGIEDALS